MAMPIDNEQLLAEQVWLMFRNVPDLMRRVGLAWYSKINAWAWEVRFAIRALIIVKRRRRGCISEWAKTEIIFRGVEVVSAILSRIPFYTIIELDSFAAKDV